MDTAFGAMIARFLGAQDPVYPQALQQLRAGRKTSHWMWFIFPQIEGLGHSEMARRYALSGLEEAAAFAGHAVLGARLRQCTAAVMLHAPDAAASRSLDDIFGATDRLKFLSSMTLFALAVPDEPLFGQALSAFNGGQRDSHTLARLRP